jgi:hypothetical protein
VWTLLINHVLPAIPESRFHIKNKWFEAWPRWNHWLALAEAPASAYWTSPCKTRFYNMLGKEDQSRKALSQLVGIFLVRRHRPPNRRERSPSYSDYEAI